MPSERTATFFRENNLNPKVNRADRSDAIHLAIVNQRLQVVEELLTLYPDPEDCLNAIGRIAPNKGRTPLHNAANLGRTMIVKCLLANKAEVDARTLNKYTPLILATKAEQSEIVNMLLDKGANVNAQATRKKNKLSALHVAAQLESLDIILNLLRCGADLSLCTADGDTPLHLAVRECREPAVALLLFHGASAMALNKKGVSPRSLVDSLPKEEKEKFEHLFYRASVTTDRNLGTFLDKFVVPNTRLDISSALHWAIQENQEAAVACLLHIDSHAVNATDSNGLYPLHQAASSGFQQCVLILLQHGADVDCTTRAAWTPLMLAAKMGHEKACQTLLQNNASLTAENDDGNTAWQISESSGHSLPMLLGASAADEGDADSEGTPWPEGELYSCSDAVHGNSSVSSPQNPKHIEDFLTSLERTWYKIGWTAEDDEVSSSRKWHGPVKIAILDTGIDLNHKEFLEPARRRTKVGKNAMKMASEYREKPQRERIKLCRNFIGGSKEDVGDLDGHGTHIAGLILSIAPRAELYVAKVESRFDSGERSTCPVQEAVKWAIEQGVDIITMPLGFTQERYELSETLREANHKGIIVFAAASNHGNRRLIAWPARDRDLAICVTSGDEYNRPSRFAPSPNRTLPMLITHGENIYSQWPTSLGGGYRKMSGTSVSTPIAAGMAAMILAFLNKTNEWNENKKREWLDWSKERSIRSTTGMRRVLERMCRNSERLVVLSAELMWEQNPNFLDLQVLSNLGIYEADEI